MNILKNKKIIISAGASGIGLATAKICLARGAYVYLCDINTKSLTKLNKNSIIAIRYATAFDQSREILTASFDKYSGNLDIKGNKKAHKKFKCEKSIWSN